MFTRSFLTVIILANAVLGHLCMMPMAYADSLPMSNDEAMDMNMTPMEPMSPAHCQHCSHVAKEQPSPMSTGCAGHCLAKGNETVSAVISSPRSIANAAVLPSSLPVVVAFIDQSRHLTEINAPPVGFPPMQMVVMLQ